jgi:UDP-glucose 4-epimerase
MEPYARSKLEAEHVLRQLTEGTATEAVIVRPPLVYGPGVRGNFLRLLRWVAMGAPLPFGAVRAQRSFIGVENLAGLLIRCATHPRAAGESFVVADGEDIALPELLGVLSTAMRKPDRVFRFPVSLLKVSASLTGRRSDFDKLTAGLRVDATRARELLQWEPSRSLVDGLGQMAEWYLRESNNHVA